MAKKYIKNCIVSIVLILSILLSPTVLFATTSSIMKDLNDFNTTISNIQKQLAYIGEATYIAKRENKSLDPLSSSLQVFNNQIKDLNTQLSEYAKTNTPNATESFTLKSLILAGDLLKYIAQNLKDQLSTTNSIEEYELIRVNVLTNTLLNQILSSLQ